jgi:hypothetical protein
VYIAYSPYQVTESQLGAACNGDLLLELNTMRILEGFKINYSRSMGLATDTAIGRLDTSGLEDTISLELPLKLDQFLLDPTLQTNEFFVQAVAFSAGSTNLADASISQIQKIVINRDDPAPGGTSSSGGTGTGGSSKAT